MNVLPSQNNFSQLLLLEFHGQYHNLNLYPTILQLECLKLNWNYSQKIGLSSQTIDQKIVTTHQYKQVNFDKKNSFDHSKIIEELSNLTLIFQPKPWFPTIEDKMLITALIPSKEALTIQLPFDSILSTPFEKLLDKNIRKKSYFINQQWCYTNLRKQIAVFCKWITGNSFIIWMKRNYKIFYQLFGSIYAETLKKKEKLFNILSISRPNNEYSLNTVESKITHVIQELYQIREANEETLSLLKKEITTLQDVNKTLTKEMENMSTVLKNISMNFKSIASQSMKSIPVIEFLTPPPPPPPMPPTCFSLSNTTKSTKKGKNSRTPTKKLSITLEKRPVITVEDLLKVTLKKIPPKNEKENKKKSEVKLFGPVVTTDMLKKVKLKSIKCKSNENVRLPLRTLKNNENQS